METSKELNLIVASETDLGEYKCTAENSGGSDEATITVALAGNNDWNDYFLMQPHKRFKEKRKEIHPVIYDSPNELQATKNQFTDTPAS